MPWDEQRESHGVRLAPWMLQLSRERFSGRFSSGEHVFAYANGGLLSVDGMEPTSEQLCRIYAEPAISESAVISRGAAAESGRSTVPLVLEAVRARPYHEALGAELRLTGVALRVDQGGLRDEVCDWLRVGRSDVVQPKDAALDRVVAAVRAGAAYFVSATTGEALYRAPSALDEMGVASLVERLGRDVYSPSSAAALLRHALAGVDAPTTSWCAEAAELTSRLGQVRESLRWFERCIDLSPSLCVAWARAVRNSGDLEACGLWFDAAEALWDDFPSVRSLGFWLARWLGTPQLARRALSSGPGEPRPELDLWAEAAQTWPDDPEVIEGYAEALHIAGRAGPAAVVLAEVTVRLDDSADRARVALLAAEYAAHAGWAQYEIAMLIYAQRQLPELELGAGRWERLLASAMEAPGSAGLAVLKDMVPPPSMGHALRESLVEESLCLAAERIEIYTALLSLEPGDEVALESLLGCGAKGASDAELVADALEHLARWFSGDDAPAAMPFLRALVGLCEGALQQPQRALWAAEAAADARAEGLRGRVRVREKVLAVMARDETKLRQVAALWRRCPQHYEEARGYYLEALRRDPGDLVASRSLERIAWVTGDHQAAERMLRMQIDAVTSAPERRALERRLDFRASIGAKRSKDSAGPEQDSAKGAWNRVRQLPRDSIDALDFARAMSADDGVGAPNPCELLRLVDAIQGTPTVEELHHWKDTFGAAAVFYRRVLEVSVRAQDSAASDATSKEWASVHPWDVGAWRQRLRFAVDREDIVEVSTSLAGIWGCPLFGELPPEALGAVGGEVAKRGLVLDALEVFGCRALKGVDLTWANESIPPEVLEWGLEERQSSLLPHDLASLVRAYRESDAGHREAWALQRLSLWPCRLDPSWIASAAVTERSAGQA